MDQLLNLIHRLGAQISQHLTWVPDFPYKGPILFFCALSVLLGTIISIWFMKRAMRSASSPSVRMARAEELAQNGEFSAARELYIELKAYGKAARMALKEGLLEEAAILAKRGGDQLVLAQTLAELGQIEPAALRYEQIGKYSEAAELMEKSGNLEKAIELHRRSGSAVVRLEALLVKTEKWSDLGELSANEFAKLHASMGANPAPHVIERAKKWAVRAGEAFTKAKLPARACEVYLQAGLYLQAAESMELAGEYVKASDLYQQASRMEDSARMLIKAGRYELAADLYEDLKKSDEVPKLLEQAGKIREARLFEARLALNRGEFEHAANLYVEGGDFGEAAPLFEEAGKLKDAAQAWAASGAYQQAAALFRQGRDFLAAGQNYALAKNFSEAGACFEQAQEIEAAVKNYEAAACYLDAGRLMESIDADRAIAYLQKVSKDDPSAWKADHALGRIFGARGVKDLAESRFGKAVEAVQLKPETLDLYYDYAQYLESVGEMPKANEIYGQILAIDFHYKDVLSRKKNIQGRTSQKRRASDSSPPPEKSFEPCPGVIVSDRYLLEKSIASGVFGIVFQAFDQTLQRPVAVKLMPPTSHMADSKDGERFLREARTIAQLSHANIVAIYDAGIEHGWYFIAMEHVDGPNLSAYLREHHPIPIDKASKIISETCDGLAYAHDRKVVHRDIKPANLLLTKTGRVKIADFGLARVIQGVDMTATQTIGSPKYMAPELIRGERFDHRVDLYSLGIVFYELLTGTTPFHEGDVGYHHVHTPARPIRELRSEVPTTLQAIVMKLLEKAPEKRFATALDVKAQVEGFI